MDKLDKLLEGLPGDRNNKKEVLSLLHEVHEFVDNELLRRLFFEVSRMGFRIGVALLQKHIEKNYYVVAKSDSISEQIKKLQKSGINQEEAARLIHISDRHLRRFWKDMGLGRW